SNGRDGARELRECLVLGGGQARVYIPDSHRSITRTGKERLAVAAEYQRSRGLIVAQRFGNRLARRRVPYSDRPIIRRSGYAIVDWIERHRRHWRFVQERIA